MVDYQLKNNIHTNGELDISPLEYLIDTTSEFENRSPEEFNAYIEELFKKPNTFSPYQGHFKLRKRRKERYCGGYY